MVDELFSAMLTGGHRNSLGRTEEVVAVVLRDHARLDELFTCVADEPDEIVRMRAGDALEKVCRERPEWFTPYVPRLLGDVGRIEQPSVMWHVAQMLEHLAGDLSTTDTGRALTQLKHYLTASSDWIVLNTTMDTLTRFARHDSTLAKWLAPELRRLQSDPRKAVAKRASKRLTELGEPSLAYRRDGR